MALAIETFFGQSKVGAAGLEQSVLVTAQGTEVITRTPMIFGD